MDGSSHDRSERSFQDPNEEVSSTPILTIPMPLRRDIFQRLEAAGRIQPNSDNPEVQAQNACYRQLVEATIFPDDVRPEDSRLQVAAVVVSWVILTERRTGLAFPKVALQEREGYLRRFAEDCDALFGTPQLTDDGVRFLDECFPAPNRENI